MSAPATLDRLVFTTSRLAELCSEKELVNQTGHDADDWPLVIEKELVDNALDACEEVGTAPVIEIIVSDAGIVVSDKGPGITPETVAGVLDYTSHTSSREAYVSPTRGAQGNALKTILSMGFALDGERGETLTCNQRQLMYCARPEILKIAKKDTLDSQYFCQTLLPNYNGDDMVNVERKRPLSLEAKRQLLIDAACHNLEEEVDHLENLTSKGMAYDDAVAQTLTKCEISDEDRPQVEERLTKAYQLVRAIQASNKAGVERRYLEHCHAAVATDQRRAAERDEAEFFSMPAAAADFSRWNSKKHWHPEEAVALSLGKNPKIVNPETLKQLRRSTSPFVSEFRARMKTLQRAISAVHISTPLRPEAFTAWAVNEGFPLPSELKAPRRTGPSAEEAKGEEINPKIRDVFFRFLVGMAIKHYNLDPDYNPEGNDKSQAFSLMVRDLHEVNAPVNEKTLREHTKKALEHARAKDLRFKKPTGKRPNR